MRIADMADGGDRRCNGDHTCLLRPHYRQHGLAGNVQRGQIGIRYAPPIGGAGLIGRPAFAETHIAMENIEPAMLRQNVFDQLLDGDVIENIDLGCLAMPACRGHERCGLLRGIDIKVGSDHKRPLARQRHGYGAPDADARRNRPATDDQRNPAFEFRPHRTAH